MVLQADTDPHYVPPAAGDTYWFWRSLFVTEGSQPALALQTSHKIPRNLAFLLSLRIQGQHDRFKLDERVDLPCELG